MGMILETLERLANRLAHRVYSIVFEPHPAQKRLFEKIHEAIEKERARQR